MRSRRIRRNAGLSENTKKKVKKLLMAYEEGDLKAIADMLIPLRNDLSAEIQPLVAVRESINILIELGLLEGRIPVLERNTVEDEINEIREYYWRDRS